VPPLQDEISFLLPITHQVNLSKCQSRFACPCIGNKENHRITESQNGRHWKGPLWVI